LLTSSARMATQRASQSLSDTKTMLILTDGSGHIMETIGDTRTIETGREVHLEHGGCWAEEKIGTNAIGTSMASKQPVQIHAAEHFCADVQRWTCAAAPIFHPIDREMLGIIDISGPPATFSSLNLALVISFADHIEALMAQSIEKDHSRLMSCFQEKQRKWASHDMMAVDRRGTIVQTSPNALRNVAQHCDLMQNAGGLSFLKSLAFGDWEADLARRFSNARLVLVRDGSTELGAVLVFPSRVRQMPEAKARGGAAAPFGSGVASEVFDAELSRQDPAHQPAARKVTDSKSPSQGKGHQSATNFVSLDPRVKAICKDVASAAKRRMPILICGQTGTGKEELARFAHHSSGRKGAFVPINCSALPESLVEAELFGYADGAYTGAHKGGSLGLIKEAHGGTLFLDEIGDMPFSLQSVLLRFLDDLTVRPIGGASSRVDVLVVSATNVDLNQAVANKRFRTDLLYRLNTMHLTLPPLGERADFEEIALHLLSVINPELSITAGALVALERRQWNGNVRELKSALARISMDAHDNVIDESLVGSFQSSAMLHHGPANGSLRDTQRARLLEVYAETGGNVSETARRLNICRNTVYKALGSGTDC
jgi:sigma-54 dependent transcriptional regulator, acetoin dehydrogenase operon transcriptional activator AcoR